MIHPSQLPIAPQLSFSAGVRYANLYTAIMTRRNLRVWTVDVGLCTLLSVTAAAGMTVDNVYHPIIDRNVFALRPVPPPPPPAEAAKPPPPRLWLTGITTIFGNRKLALLKGNFPNKPGEPAKDQSFILGEGERDGDVE